MSWKIIFVVFLVLLLAGCATTTKTSINQTQELQNQVKQLQTYVASLEEELQNKDQEIIYLESELENSKNTQQEAENTPIKKLSYRQIQTALKNAGFYNGSIDGKLGKQTKNAIKAFQKAQGLKADGVVGKRTASALSKYLAK
jgi:peptidoglycan hydrolase-like protein with peptidoglycan-binding domain